MMMRPGFAKSSGGAWLPSASVALNANNSAGWSGYTILTVIASAQVSNTGGSKIRVTVDAPSASTYVVGAAYIGLAATSGDPYDFESSPGPVQLTWGGSATPTFSAGSVNLSDEIVFSIPASRGLVFAMYSASSSTVRVIAAATGYSSYFKSGNDASTVNRSGYTDYTSIFGAAGVSKVESLA